MRASVGTDMTIDLPIHMPGGWRVVEATIVHISPHMCRWTWALHRSMDKGWLVSNIETGCRCMFWASHSPVEAIEYARQFLATQTDATMDIAVAKMPRECRE